MKLIGWHSVSAGKLQCSLHLEVLVLDQMQAGLHLNGRLILSMVSHGLLPVRVQELRKLRYRKWSVQPVPRESGKSEYNRSGRNVERQRQ